MPFPMPNAVCVPHAPWWLSSRRAGLRNARASPWCVLRRLLLDTDGAVVRGRDERALDRPPRVTRFFGEDLQGPADLSACRDSPDRRRWVVSLNGNVLTAWTLPEQKKARSWPDSANLGGAAVSVIPLAQRRRPESITLDQRLWIRVRRFAAPRNDADGMKR